MPVQSKQVEVIEDTVTGFDYAGPLGDLQISQPELADMLRRIPPSEFKMSGVLWDSLPRYVELSRRPVQASYFRPVYHQTKRLIVAVAGSGWGKTTFKRRCDMTPLKVVDIDDVLPQGPEVDALRIAAIEGEISWQTFSDYVYPPAIAAIRRIQPDILLKHGPYKRNMAELAEDFFVEEFDIIPPSAEVVRERIELRDGGDMPKELQVKVALKNWRGLMKYREQRRVEGIREGTWNELYDTSLNSVLDEETLQRDPIMITNIDVLIDEGYDEKRVNQVRERVHELGHVGEWLLRHLTKDDLLPRSDIDGERHWMGIIRRNRGEPSVMAYSMLAMEFPMQVQVNEYTLRTFISQPFNLLGGRMRPQVNLDDTNERRRAYPPKNHPGALNKVNVFLRDILKMAKLRYKFIYHEFSEMSAYHEGVYEDQACAIILMAGGLLPYFKDPVRLATKMLLDPDTCKNLTTCLKSLGLNATPLGSRCCEANSLLGRGAKHKDLHADAIYRLGGDKLNRRLHKLDSGKLRNAVRAVLKHEITEKVEYPTMRDHWTSRWDWCVNGSHSRILERQHPEFVIEPDALKKKQLHRKVFMEMMFNDPRDSWDGVSHYSASVKLEQGKGRAIYAGDSVTYAAFEHLFKPVEKIWANRRVILDPGKLGTLGMSRRLKKLWNKGGVNVMLDYDDFNSRHSIDAMCMVVEELCALTDYPEDRRDLLLHSLRNGYIYIEGRLLGKIEGTLMSGHRGTTFFNSILCMAYVVAVFPELWNMFSMHVGDDVYILAPDYRVAYSLLRACKLAGLALNPLKQSVGTYSAEFLRTAYGRDAAYGYLARSIGACVCGNWANDKKLDPDEGIRTIVGHAWTLYNRSQLHIVPHLLAASLSELYYLPLSVAEELVIGTVGLGGGPVRTANATLRTVALKVDTRARDCAIVDAIHGLGESATIDYLTYHTTPVEQMVLEKLQTSIKGLMKETSYKKTVTSSSDAQLLPKVGISGNSMRMRAVFRQASAEDVWNKSDFEAPLRKHPLLSLMKNRIPDELLQDILLAETGKLYPIESVRSVAWGEESYSMGVSGFLSYADATRMAAAGQCDLAYANYPCCA